MAPSVASLYCAEEDVSGAGAWDSYEEERRRESTGGIQRLTTIHFQPVVLLDFPVEDEDAIAMLMKKEAYYMPEAEYSGRYRSRLLNAGARQNAIRWMLKVQAYHNFVPLTVALSVNYMDRFMSRHHLPQGKVWMLQLLSVACMSLAAKMEETEVPILLDLQVEDVEHIFEAHTIQRMELLVLSTLDWRMSSVTPFSYIDYYFHKLGISNVLLRALLSRVSEIILATLRETVFLVYQPSVIAAAATICSLEEVTPLKATDLHRVFVDLSVDGEALKKCYHDLQKYVLGDPNDRQQPSKRKVFWCLPEPLSPVGVLEAASLSRNGSKSSSILELSCESTSLGMSLAPASNVHKRRKLDDFHCGTPWL
ncbi:unnamed protein product [Sphagnum balticum]